MNKCHICGYEWTSRVTLPKQCPNCKRYSWFKTVFKNPIPSPPVPPTNSKALGINTPTILVNDSKAKSADISNKKKEGEQEEYDDLYMFKEDD